MPGAPKNPQATYWLTLRKAEVDMIEWAVREAGGVEKASRILGVGYSFLYRRIRHLKLKHLYQFRKPLGKAAIDRTPGRPWDDTKP